MRFRLWRQHLSITELFTIIERFSKLITERCSTMEIVTAKKIPVPKHNRRSEPKFHRLFRLS